MWYHKKCHYHLTIIWTIALIKLNSLLVRFKIIFKYKLSLHNHPLPYPFLIAKKGFFFFFFFKRPYLHIQERERERERERSLNTIWKEWGECEALFFSSNGIYPFLPLEIIRLTQQSSKHICIRANYLELCVVPFLVVGVCLVMNFLLEKLCLNLKHLEPNSNRNPTKFKQTQPILLTLQLVQIPHSINRLSKSHCHPFSLSHTDTHTTSPQWALYV